MCYYIWLKQSTVTNPAVCHDKVVNQQFAACSGSPCDVPVFTKWVMSFLYPWYVSIMPGVIKSWKPPSIGLLTMNKGIMNEDIKHYHSARALIRVQCSSLYSQLTKLPEVTMMANSSNLVCIFWRPGSSCLTLLTLCARPISDPKLCICCCTCFDLKQTVEKSIHQYVTACVYDHSLFHILLRFVLSIQ